MNADEMKQRPKTSRPVSSRPVTTISWEGVSCSDLSDWPTAAQQSQHILCCCKLIAAPSAPRRLCFVLFWGKKKQFAWCDRILLQCVSFCLPVGFFFSFLGSQTKDVVQVEGPRHPRPENFGFYLTYPLGNELIKSIWKGKAKLGM